MLIKVVYMGIPQPEKVGISSLENTPGILSKSKVELLAQRLRDQVESGGREGNATVAWCIFF